MPTSGKRTGEGGNCSVALLAVVRKRQYHCSYVGSRQIHWILRFMVLKPGKKGDILNANKLLGTRMPLGKEMMYELTVVTAEYQVEVSERHMES